MAYSKQSRTKTLLYSLIFVTMLTVFFYINFLSVFGRSPVIAAVSPRSRHPYLSATEEAMLETKLANAESRPKVILAWDGEKYRARYIRPKTPFLERECGSCMVTTDESYVNAEETAAIVINYMSIKARKFPPRRARRSNQLYVFQVGEPPPLLTSFGNLRIYKSVDSLHFNATMMVWRDSNIYGPFGSSRKAYEDGKALLKKSLKNDVKNILKVKSKMAVAVVSNCKASAGARVRVAFIKALLDQGLAVDKFGRCFANELPRSKEKRLYFSEFLFPYKFYLSFENAFHCKDYITEKFFSNGLSNFAVPVVWGAAKEDYMAVAPPNSFIHVDDFDTVEDLVEYLKYLDQNDDAYLQYLKWVYDPIEKFPQYYRRNGYCQLCRIINGINVDDVYSSRFDMHGLERPLLSTEVSYRTVPPFKELMDSMESTECFWNLEDFQSTNRTLAARAGRKYL